jgi:hypothetical protein
MRHDQVGYYAYLPALLHEDGLSFRWASGPRWEGFRRSGFGGFRTIEATGRVVDVYTPGVAVLQAPFFAAAHAVAWASGAEHDGFSWPYRLLAALGGATYASLGLLLLALALGACFPPGIAAGTVVILGLGTNLLYYGTFEPLMSHAYSFFALSLALWSVLDWDRRPRLRTAVLTGAALGLAVSIRPTNLLFGVVPLAYVVRHGRSEGARSALEHLAAGGAAMLVGVSPMLSYWRFATGSWLTNPWGGGTFYWTDPEIRRLLFSFRKGWFVYTPAMLALIPGLILLRRYVPKLTAPLLVYFAAAVYVAASWWNWWYGGSWGMRAMIEVSAPMSVALAACLMWASEGSAVRRRVVGAVFGVLVGLNLFQTVQYRLQFIRWDGMTAASYGAVFLRPRVSGEKLERIYSPDRLSHDGQRGRREVPPAP